MRKFHTALGLSSFLALASAALMVPTTAGVFVSSLQDLADAAMALIELDREA